MQSDMLPLDHCDLQDVSVIRTRNKVGVTDGENSDEAAVQRLAERPILQRVEDGGSR